jgi:WD40 repeat protein
MYPRIIVMGLVLGLLSACASAPRRASDWSREDAHTSGSVVAFNQGSTLLASGGLGGWVSLWSLPEGGAGPGWRAHDGPVTGLAFIDGQDRILSAGWDGTLALWSQPGVLERRLVTTGPVTAIAFESASRRLLTGYSDGSVKVWALPDLEPVYQQRLHQGKVKAVAIQSGGSILASSGTDGQVFLWREGGPARDLEAPASDVWSLAFSPDRKYLMGSGWFNIFRWSLDNERLVVLPTEHHGIISSISFSEEGSLAAISRQTDSAVDILDPSSGLVLERLQKHALCGSDVSFAPNSRYLATTSDDASVRFWDIGTGDETPPPGAAVPVQPLQ